MLAGRCPITACTRRPAASSRAPWRCAAALHRHPELGLDLPRTRDAVVAALADLPLQVHLGRSVSSVVAVLDGDRPGPTVLLRGDMDALPLPEDTGLRVRLRGRRARCTPAGTTRTSRCSPRRPGCWPTGATSWPGGCVFMFQPGEEGFHGARYMIDEGLLDRTGPGRPPGRRVRAAHQRDRCRPARCTCGPGR